MVDRVWEYVCKNHMLTGQDRVVAGISGGADSVCLLLLLLEFQRRLPFELCAVHVEHGIRGEEALRDAAFTEELCRSRGIEFRMIHKDVPARAKKERLSLEEAARYCRYEALSQVVEEWGGTKIAVAHHKNDQAETMLLNLFRGTGLKGMCGMAPVQGMLIRPLLCAGREEIEAWLGKQGISYCTDSTNLQEDYARNRIRSRILPEACRINTRAAEHLANACASAREAQDFLEREAARAYDRTVHEKEKELFLDREAFEQEDILITKYILFHMLENLSGRRKDITAEHIGSLLCLMEQQTGKQVSLPDGLYARKSYGGIYMGQRNEEKGEPAEYDLCIPGEIFLPDGSKFTLTIETRKKDFCIPRKTYTKWFDYDKIESSLKLRTRKAGDYIAVNSQGGTKKLKDYFIDKKIDRTRRDNILLLAQESHVLWVPGYRISEAFRVTEQTKRVLKVQAEGGNFHE